MGGPSIDYDIPKEPTKSDMIHSLKKSIKICKEDIKYAQKNIKIYENKINELKNK